MNEHRLNCGHCGANIGTAAPDQLRFRGRGARFAHDTGWNDDPIRLDPADPAGWPVHFHCPRCRGHLALGRPPWPPRRIVVPAHPCMNP